jgi:F0F1-type ATP synthase assembly protein I
MLGGLGDRKQLARYLTLSQVGFEMVVPIVIGLVLDNYFDWSPWGVAIGAVLGLALGLIHLVHLTSKEEDSGKGDSAKPELRP